MKPRELAQWLLDFPDQEADIEVISSTYSYEGHNNVNQVLFDLEKHVDYVDFRNNPFVEPDWRDKRFLLLGAYE